MQTIRKQKSITDETGNTTVFVTIFLLCMLILATATVTLAKTQWNMSMFSRQTSNSYFLARSGAEKIVDSMNKEVATELPKLMEAAANKARDQMLQIEVSGDGVTYKAETNIPYDGEYKGREYENLYEVKLKEEIYNHIITKFEDPTSHKALPISYKAYSDTKGNEPIEVIAKVYHKASTAVASNVPVDIVDLVNGLIAPDEIGTSDKEAFAVEVIAVAKKDTKTSLTKSRVVGTISLHQLATNDEQLLEEYEWAVDEHGKGIYPEALQAAIISFGDLVIQGGYKATIGGDVHIKGTQRKVTETEYINSDFPEPDEWGGICVSDGGKLEVEGSAFVVSNIQTRNSDGKERAVTTITVQDDAIANTIAIHDNYYEGSGITQPWNHYVQNNTIKINRSAYVDNDIRIDRYVEGGKINVTGSVFGISDKDPKGYKYNDGGVEKTIVDPNKSSGIFSLGLHSTITMGKVFVAGQPFINFRDGNGYHALHESIGEPFQDVYYLEAYRTKLENDDSYLTQMSDLINKAKIWIEKTNGNKPYAFAPRRVSATIVGETEGESYDVSSGPDPMTNQTEANKIFYLGLNSNFPEDWKNKLANESDWSKTIVGINNTWGSIIADPLDFYKGNNSFNKVYILEKLEDGTDFEYDQMLGYKGLQGYMLAKRGVFYNQFKKTSGTTQYEPVERTFDDLIDVTMFTQSNEWSYNNPIHIATSSESIDISKLDGIPTAIICTDPNATITLKADTSSKNVFNGIIITAGRLNIISDITIKGTIVAGNEYMSGLPPSRESIQRGDWAGVQISAGNVKFDYDGDMLLSIRCMDKSLQRKLYDCLAITSYQSFTSIGTNEQDQINAIMGEQNKRKVRLSKTSVISSKQGGLQFVMKSLRKL